MLNPYVPGSFAKEYATPLGQALWPWLNSTSTVALLESASDLGHPAVAGIEEALLKEFGAPILADRVKMMIGHMVRQVLEIRGWEIEREGVTMASVPFFKATRYRRKDGFSAQVFRSSADPRQLCLAPNKTGRKLPADPAGGRWTHWCAVTSRLRANVGIGLDARECEAAMSKMRADGFYLHHMPRLLRAG